MHKQQHLERPSRLARDRATPADAAPSDLLTVKQFSERFPAWTQPAIRNLILNADPRINSRGKQIGGNGLREAGAIFHVARRVLLSPSRFLVWVAAQQTPQRKDPEQHAPRAERRSRKHRLGAPRREQQS